ncbi:MAG: Gfo/Idh/MocA family oxidoreductase [Planctomycetes bacterium]|nr:Gfo/Idh/MocA family oxidoreductase [Planctomycetota bacterium]
MGGRLRLAVMGPGIYWNKAHRPALARRDDVEVVAFCASSDRRRAEVAAAFPGRPFYTDADAFLAEVAADAVLLTLPLPLNGPMAARALEAGHDVIVEKPLARSAAEAFALASRAEAEGRQLMVAEQLAYAPILAEIRARLDAGAIGRPVVFDMVTHIRLDASHPDGYGRGWRKEADFPLGALFDGGVHQIAIQSRLFGPHRRVYARGTSLREGFGEFDHVLMHFAFDGGFCGTFSHAGSIDGPRNHFHIHGTEGLIDVEGDAFTLLRPSAAPQRVVVEGDDARTTMWTHLLARLRDGAPPAYSAFDAAGDVATLEAVAASCRTGRSVDIGPGEAPGPADRPC